MSLGRGERLGLLLDLIEWLDGRRAPFGAVDVAQAIELGPRTAWRYLDALEARGLVEVVKPVKFGGKGPKDGPTLWVSRVGRGRG